MKIQHIRRNKKIIGTIVAVKNESKGIVNVGYSMVMKGDNPTKKIGVSIALDRALNGTNGLSVPKKIEPEFREFLNHISVRSEFQGFHTPLADDFSYTYKPISWVGYGVHSEY
jgi:hypothetical protein